VILVGVTGVGKSTVLQQLAKRGLHYSPIPDRRDLTDRLLIAQMQVEAGLPIEPVRDRRLRFDYTRRYREQYPGGMAHALAQLCFDPGTAAPLLLFDGLRGENEVIFAAENLPQARFVMLDAPDVVRVQRLLGRGDAFDQVASVESGAQGESFAALGIPEAATVFAPEQERDLFAWARRASVTDSDLRDKLAIVVEERRNYDPGATAAALRAHAPERLLYMDTTTHGAKEVADGVYSWLTSWLSELPKTRV
jgi:hypothetical protein